MSGSPHAGFLALAHAMADAAALVQRRWFRQPLAVDHKADDSPVTRADRESEAAMRALIQAHCPDHGILGEEHGTEGRDRDYLWCLDPIDGTKAFITGRPQFGTLIALLHRGRPVLGIIDQSILCERWVGLVGAPSTWNDQPIRTRPCDDPAKAVLMTTSPRMFKGADLEAFDRVERRAGLTLFGGDCYSYGLLAAGFADLVIESGLQTYDFMALVPVIEGAGGMITDWQGERLHLGSTGRVLAAGDARLHATARDLLDLTGS